jgi:hypothetical protein
MRNHPQSLRAALVAALALALCPAPARAAYHSLESIPVESPIYRMVEDLAASYGLGSSFLATQPWDRADLGRFLDELVLDAPAAATDPLVVRLRRELEPGGRAGGWEPMRTFESDEGDLELSTYALTNFAQDRARASVVRDFRAGLQASAALGEDLLLWTDVYAGTTSPGAHGNPANSRHFGLIEGVQLNHYIDRGTMTWRGRRGRLQVGHTWLRWGPGAWGTMALSDGAPAFDVAEARVPVLHRLQLEWFIATLDPLDQSYLAGHRIEWRPSGGWDVSFAELARFEGASSVPLYVVPVIPFGHVEKRVLKASGVAPDSIPRAGQNNVMWSADFTWRWRPGVRLYGEVAVDDISFSSEKRPRALAWQAGVDARRVRGGNAWTLRGEYSRVYQYTYSSYHGQHFEFAGSPTGFPLGTDVDRLNGRLEWQRGPALRLGLEGAYTRKGESEIGDYYVPGSGAVNNLVLTGVLDADARGGTTIDWSPAPGLSLGVTGGWASIKGPNHVFGATADGAYGQTRGTLRW